MFFMFLHKLKYLFNKIEKKDNYLNCQLISIHLPWFCLISVICLLKFQINFIQEIVLNEICNFLLLDFIFLGII